MVDEASVSRKKRSRRGRRAAPARGSFEQLPFSQPQQGSIAPTAFASTDEVQALHEASLRLLRDTGIAVLDDTARELMRGAGATVAADGTRVHFDPELMTIGANRIAFCMMASAPNASCMDYGRRTGNVADFQNFLKLAQIHNVIHSLGGYPCEPVDRHASMRHIECVYDFLTLTDKSYCIYSLGAQRNRDAIELTRIGRGVSSETLASEPSVWTVINTNSPMQLDIPMLQGIIEMSSMGQPVVITPFTLSGAMAPVTIAGALVQQNAEALAGIAFSQIVKRGSPAVYGGFTSNVDMKSGSPAFGTPEYMKAQMIGGQLARFYNIPYRSSNVCAANTVDAQAAYESVFSLWGAIAGGANILKHGAGWLEGGLCCSFEKTILDIDLLQMVQELLKPLDFSEDALALDTIDEVGPGGHFFGTEHTQQRYKEAFYAPVLSDWRNFETWLEAGQPTAMEKANRLYKERLSSYQAPLLGDDIREELDAFVAMRREEGGVATDF